MNHVKTSSPSTPLEVKIPMGEILLSGGLAVPPRAPGIVVFAHGSGSSRFSSRNRFVARELNDAGLATLLFDLLTQEEEDEDRKTSKLRFDIELLATRLGATIDWVQGHGDLQDIPLGLFGASTGAAAALAAAAEYPGVVSAVVSRGGRPDLARRWLMEVEAPTLLIVGERDPRVIEWNLEARRQIHAECELEIVSGATHLFEEPGALEEVARMATIWFGKYLHGGHTGPPTI